MHIKVIDTALHLEIHGFAGIAVNREYSATAFRLMDKMWQVVKSQNLKNKGLNIWLYEPNEKMFAGVELDDNNKHNTGLEQKTIHLAKYAYYKHIGPYNLIKQAGQNMIDEIKKKGFKICDPYIEIYGHWTNDEAKLETELIMNIQ